MKYLPIALLVLGTVTYVKADIPIQNPGFEADALCSGCATLYSITGWTGTPGAGSRGYWGVANPTATQYPGGVPGGSNLAYLTEQSVTTTISQILTTTLQANDTYTLTFDAGRRLDTAALPPGLGCYGFDASLLAGGTVLKTLTQSNNNQSCGLLTVGAFTQLSFSYTSGANPVGLGSQLEIKFTVDGSGSIFEPAQIDFDQVSLRDTLSSVTPVPEAGTIEILGYGLVLAGWFRRKVRRD